jgi:hypothetical protein
MTNSTGNGLGQAYLQKNLVGRMQGSELNTLDPITATVIHRDRIPKESDHRPYAIRHIEQLREKSELREAYRKRTDDIAFNFNKDPSNPAEYQRPVRHGYEQEAAQQNRARAAQEGSKFRDYGTSHANIFSDYAGVPNPHYRRSRELGRDEYYKPPTPQTAEYLNSVLPGPVKPLESPAYLNNRRFTRDVNMGKNIFGDAQPQLIQERFDRGDHPHLKVPDVKNPDYTLPRQNRHGVQAFVPNEGAQPPVNPNNLMSPSKSVFVTAAREQGKRRLTEQTYINPRLRGVNTPPRVENPREAPVRLQGGGRPPQPPKSWTGDSNIFGTTSVQVPGRAPPNPVTNNPAVLEDWRKNVYANETRATRAPPAFG